MVDRIKQLIEFKGLSTAAFAESININRSGLSHIFSGRNQPSLDLVMKILETYPEVSTEWLMFGKGKMFQETPSQLESPGGAPIQPVPIPTRTPDLFSQTIEEPQPTDIIPSAKQEISNDEIVIDNLEEEGKKTDTVTKRGKRKKENKISNPGDIPTRTSNKIATSDSREVKTIEKIIFFYSDNTFTIFEEDR
ncbi:MAG TPA: helix-turn-helix transcriptional regulator [Bacteroidales bacterium]|nr:helix-turn-helix transcriptional regulator [Bacteroidales bacterium]HOS57670.1 helix-turn-helix transcriptional regulator [Bacteroidales bacterium]HRR03954.1 helix-turn-helix transcriptional regulator [Bacteroidales bacterium]HRT14158.1 helix-turn-helix transcriptional regulator [Bacteroidales bacterium]HXK74050.1 helix-turn-helix transcriptional regulator [Bacteroidales bacterium]